MGLYYPIQTSIAVIGSKDSSFTLTTSALTAAYADNRKVIAGIGGMSKLDLRYSYTSGASETSNTLSILIEQSEDLTNWFSIVNESVSGGTSAVTARTFVDSDNTSAANTITSSIGLDIFYKNIRVSFKEGGVSANYGTIYSEATVLGE